MSSSMNVSDVLRDVGLALDPLRSISLTVTYGETNVTDGLYLRASQVQTKPHIEIGGANDLNFYTLVMVDADAPNPNTSLREEYLHWLWTDIPQASGTPFGNEIVSYTNPSPIKGLFHRILMILFRQPGEKTVHESECNRLNFNTRAFAESYMLDLPVAAVFFNCYTV